MTAEKTHPLLGVETRLRHLLPAELYVHTWLTPKTETLLQAHEHLRTLYHTLFDYVPRSVANANLKPGTIRWEWQTGTLMFTDLVGFTTLLESYSTSGETGAMQLMEIVNSYFGRIIEIIGVSDGQLLEFTGDAVLVQFLSNRFQNDTEQAVNTALRMQRAMAEFKEVPTPRGPVSLSMRVGIHVGRYLVGQIGTPRRMAQVLLGTDIRTTKLAEGGGVAGRVNLTTSAFERVSKSYRTESGTEEQYHLIIDDLTEEQLGTYDLGSFVGRRIPSSLIMDKSVAGLTDALGDLLDRLEPLAAYLPQPVLDMVVEEVDRKIGIKATFADLTIMFVNLIGLSENINRCSEDEAGMVVARFSEIFALMNAAVETNGGVLKHVTYHLNGADMLIYFGLPNAHANNAARAAHTADAIRRIVMAAQSPYGADEKLAVKIGLSRGTVFAAEVGAPRGRREFNILGDSVNVAARLMGVAEPNQILLTEAIYHDVWQEFDIEPLPKRIPLKGKSRAIPVFSVLAPIRE
ncbi:MAG: adenylate/guanylate cyclase domain-containing protein [Anaerolineae bacterium]